MNDVLGGRLDLEGDIVNPDRMNGALCPGCGEWLQVQVDVATNRATLYCPHLTTESCIDNDVAVFPEE